MFEDSGLETLLSTTEEKLNLWQVLIYLQVQQGSDWLVVYMGGLVVAMSLLCISYQNLYCYTDYSLISKGGLGYRSFSCCTLFN